MTKDPNNQSTQQNPVGRFMVAAGAVLEYNNTGKILIIQRSPKLDWQPLQWEIGYGRIDQFEDVETGLRRELYEELGLTDVEITRVLRVWHIFRGSEKPENELIGITYHCRTHNQEIQLSSEHVAYQWVEPEQALKLVSIEGIKRDIQHYVMETTSSN